MFSGLIYCVTALGCLGWGRKLFPQHEQLLKKHGPELATGVNTCINIGRVFVSPVITPLGLTLAGITPIINNRLYTWAERNKAKRFTIADRTVHGISIFAKASKRFSNWDDGKIVLLESLLSRIGRDITKDKLFKPLNINKAPQTNQEHFKTIGAKLLSKYTWNIICFGLIDFLLDLFWGKRINQTKHF